MTGVVSIPPPGEVIAGQYRLEREIGQGGYGVVFEARQLDLGRRVAIKMLTPSSMVDADVRERFEREARLASSLQHRNSVTIYSYGVYGGDDQVLGLPYIAMEYLEGEDLQSYLYRIGPLSIPETVRILIHALGSISEAHGMGIIHRDLKPENLFLCSNEDAIKVLDFGIAKAISGDWGSKTLLKLTAAGMVCGTPEFMAPEQASGEPDLTPAVDVYAMGCIAFQMLTGDPPYDGRTPLDVAQKHLFEPIPSFPDHVKQSFFGPILLRSLSKDPNTRFTNAQEFLDRLETSAEKSGVLANIHADPIVIGADEILGEQPTGPREPGYRGPTVVMPESADDRGDPAPAHGAGAVPGREERRRPTLPARGAAKPSTGRWMAMLAIPIAFFLLLGLIGVALLIAWPWISRLIG